MFQPILSQCPMIMHCKHKLFFLVSQIKTVNLLFCFIQAIVGQLQECAIQTKFESLKKHSWVENWGQSVSCQKTSGDMKMAIFCRNNYLMLEFLIFSFSRCAPLKHHRRPSHLVGIHLQVILLCFIMI